MADVYKAVHNSLGVHRALKVILPELVVSHDFRTRFQKEAQAVASLRHQNIVQVHDFGTQDSVYFMVMEFIEGRDLKRLLATQGRIRPIGQAVALVLKIADALGYAHERGIVHRDIKPENVMITGSGEPILTDFGIAKLITADTNLTRTGASIGTPAYMAPEQALGSADICPATDIYALTIVLYELLTGTVPFKADTPVGLVMKTLSEPLPKPQLVCPDIGDELQDVLIKGAAKSLADRYESIEEFRSALTDALARDASGLTSSSRRTTMLPPTRERQMPARESSSTAKAVAVAALTVFITAGAGYLWMEPQMTRDPPVAASPVVAPPANETRIERDVAPGSAPVQVATVDVPLAKKVVVASIERARPKAAPRSTRLESSPPVVQVAAASAPVPPEPQSAPVTSVASSGPLAEVRKGTTTQSDLLRLFGGPNLTTYDETGLETWIYERTLTQVDTVSSDQSRQGSASLGLFFKSVEAGVSGSKSTASGAVSTRSAVRSTTVIVKFSADRTVYDYSVKETYF